MNPKHFSPLNLPKADLKISQKGDDFLVWCIIRKKQLVLTPEEWVRQHAIHYLIHSKNISLGKINSEHLVKINGQNRRCDIVVIDPFGNPELIVECKANDIAIDEKVFLQTSNYIQETKARYFWMTNGLFHVVWDCKEGCYLTDLPEF